MAGIAAIKSKLRTLEQVAVEKQHSNSVSVVRYNRDRNIEWPEYPNPRGVLLVPKPCSAKEWEQKGLKWLSTKENG